MLLDFVEVACSHTGLNLAIVFAGILEEFGISHKVRFIFAWSLIVISNTLFSF